MSILSKACNLVGKLFGPLPRPSPLSKSAQTKLNDHAQGRKINTPNNTQGTSGLGEFSPPNQERLRVRMSRAEVSSIRLALTSADPQLYFLTHWIAELVRHISKRDEARTDEAYDDFEQVQRSTHILLASIFGQLEKLAAEFNAQITHAPHCITVTEVQQVNEPFSPQDKSNSKIEAKSKSRYLRCRASSSTHSLSVRGKEGTVEAYLVPVHELMQLCHAETAERLILRLKLYHTTQGELWHLAGFPIDQSELTVLIRNLFKDLTLACLEEPESKMEIDPFKLPHKLKDGKWSEAIEQLVNSRQNLLQKIVTQQEDIQNHLARELHDAVIADIMMLKRSLAGDKQFTDQEMVKVLDQITQRLREICHDLSPRDLKDWGLHTVIEDLLQRSAKHSGVDFVFNCDQEIPDLPNAVQLHIYRIVQECVNNIEKYAEATRVIVNIDVKDGLLTLSIQDNGKGFNPEEKGVRRALSGGLGMGSIRERAELIRCFYPAQISIDSKPKEGSRTTLTIKLVK